ncbi:hypothetical protein PINS_up017562 [Pythium insidiosum]|nr:hypothetical protein PINS_up017562 [Pythium insidiosum]
MVANTLQVDYIEDFGDHMLGVLPFYHYLRDAAHARVRCNQGAANVVLPRFEPEPFLNALSKYKPTLLPPIAIFLAHHPLGRQVRSLIDQFLVSGGAPMGKGVDGTRQETPWRRSKGKAVRNDGSFAGVNYTEDHMAQAGAFCGVSRYRSCSLVADMWDLCTGQRRKTRAEHRTSGQVHGHGPGPAGTMSTASCCTEGPQVMLGYLNNDEATRKTLTPDGFLRTGDVGYIDEHGFVHVVDRVKELIKYKGHQVAPAELEDLLNHHPDIADSCCVRGYDQHGEEIPKAFVVLVDKGQQQGTDCRRRDGVRRWQGGAVQEGP